MADLQFTVDYKQLKEANREISKVGSNAQKSASVFEAAFKRAEAQSVKSARAVREQITFSQRLERQKVREANAVAAAATKVANEEERLRRKYVEGYAAMDLYSKELNELAIARKANLISIEQQIQLTDRLNKQMASGTGVFSGYGTAQQAATKSSNSMGVVTQQAGYQVGDFLVQVQGGTNVMVAFGQQATQLVGVLPLIADRLGMTTKAAIGLSAALGIGIPLVTAIGAFLLRARESANKAAEGVDTLANSIESLNKSLQDYLRTKKAAELGITVEELLGTQNIAGAEAELNSARGALERLIISASVTPTGTFAGVAIVDFIKQKLATDEVTAAVQRLTAAENTLAILRQKQAEERRGNYNEEARELGQRTALLEEQVRYGEDSVQVLRLESAQRKANYGLQVSSMNLTESQMLALIRLNNAYEDSVTSQQELKRNQEVLKEGGQAFLNIWNAITGRITESTAQIKEAITALDQMKIEFSFRGRSMGQYGGRGTVSNRPISGDVPEDAEVTRGGAISIKDPLPELLKRLALDERLLGVSEERAAVERAIADSDVTYSQASIDAAVKRLEAYNLEKQALEEVAATQEKIASTIENSMENAFMSVVDGTKSAKDAFKSMAADIIKELYRVLVVKRLVSGITGALGFADGGAFSGGSEVKAYANGGVVGGPTYFPMSGGKTGLMGEAGPEAIMPLKRGANGKLGVQMEGGGGDTIVVNQSFNFQANGDDSVKRIIAQAAPQIAQMTKKSIIDDRRRGGQMKATFG